MIRQITITLLENPEPNELFKLDINVPSEFVHLFTAQHIFRTEDLPQYIFLGPDIAATAVNMFEYFTIFYSAYPFISVEQLSDGVKIIIDAFEVTSSTILGTLSVLIIHATTQENPPDEIYVDGIFLSRSPYFVEITPSELFDKATMELKLWRGDYDVDEPLDPNYVLSKQVVQAGQERIIFDISTVANDFVKAQYSNMVNSQAAFTSSVFQSVWIKALITATYQEDTLGSVEKTFIAVDGFGYHEEGFNPDISQKVLSTNDRHIIYPDTAAPLYFVTEGLTSITINGQDVPFTFNQTFNNQRFAYVNMAAFIDTEPSFDAVFEYGEETITHTFDVKEECRYEVVNCIFKNKFGFWQSIPFNKVSKDRLTKDSQSYEANISTFGQYSTLSHIKKQFLVNGQKSILVNTDFIPEYYNPVFTELFMSEFVYLERGGQVSPVNITSQNIEYKTVKVNKLIQYSLEFEYAFPVINTVK